MSQKPLLGFGAEKSRSVLLYLPFLFLHSRVIQRVRRYLPAHTSRIVIVIRILRHPLLQPAEQNLGRRNPKQLPSVFQARHRCLKVQASRMC